MRLLYPDLAKVVAGYNTLVKKHNVNEEKRAEAALDAGDPHFEPNYDFSIRFEPISLTDIIFIKAKNNAKRDNVKSYWSIKMK